MRLAIAVPTYNEAANVGPLIDALADQAAAVEDLEVVVLVIDDASPDGTADVAAEAGRARSNAAFQVEVIRRPGKQGLGPAYVEAFRTVLAGSFDAVLQMDADLSHDPRYLPAFVDLARHNDLVVGTRYVPGGGTPDWTFLRKALSRGGNRYARLWLGRQITDYTGGFNLYSVDLLKKVDPERILTGGYGFAIEIKYRALQSAERFAELPIVFVDRKHGRSKIPKSTVLTDIFLVPRLRFGGRDAWRPTPPG